MHPSQQAPEGGLWAGAFDVISVAVIFLAIAAAAEGLGFNLSRWSVFGLVYFIYNLVCLFARDGRTLGKTAVDICVVSAAGRRLTAAESITRAAVRSWPFFLLDAQIARVLDGYLSFPLTLLAGTLLLAALFIAETTLLASSPTRQTIADRLAGSLVVNLPPMQPHRAPAIPMYSARMLNSGILPAAQRIATRIGGSALTAGCSRRQEAARLIRSVRGHMGTVGAIFGVGYAVYLLTSLVYVAISVRHGKWLLIGTVLISLACFVASIVTINELGSSLKEHQ